MSPLVSLPIDAVLPPLIAALERHPAAVLHAPTGAGKTTRVPPALLAAGLAGERQVIVLQPRRLAARASAARMAAEMDVRLGEEVGYQIRFDRRAGPATRILVVTEGLLVRMLQDDPFLERAGVVIFDEFHERHLDTDLALAMARKVQLDVRPDLKLVVMSATLAAAPVAKYLGDAPIITSAGRLYPVDVHYSPPLESASLVDRTAAGVEQILARTAGDILVFLPGVGEIRQVHAKLEPLAISQKLRIAELYGDLPADEQDAALAMGRERKVILATNVAETSVTVEGVTGVVDSGYARVLRLCPDTGLDRLELERISRASAEQRAGRAGRTSPGVCLRLWSEREQRGLSEFDTPEVQRVDLAGPVLELRAWGENDLSAFDWYEPPPAEALARAERLLVDLDAIDRHGLTEIGKQMVRLPIHPRLARLLVAGAELGQTRRAARTAALLGERDPFVRRRERGGPPRQAAQETDSDVVDRLQALEIWADSGQRHSLAGEIHVPSAKYILRSAEQLERMLARVRVHPAAHQVIPDDAIRWAIFTAFADRLAKRREAGSPRGVMRGGRGVKLVSESAVRQAALFVCVDLDAGQSEALVRQASAVDRAWLPEDEVETATEVLFDPERERVIGLRTTRWHDLILEQSPAAPSDDQRVVRVLAAAAVEAIERVLPADHKPLMRFLARVRKLREWMPELELPSFDVHDLADVLPELCRGRRSFADLRSAPWLDWLQNRLTADQQRALDRETPERWGMPGGLRIAIDYEVDGPPVLAAKIQQFFGMADTPRIAGGRIPLLLHLLAPNGRPQQVTQDLPSFWANTYAQVRKDLRRRYPKHAWPEDPRIYLEGAE